MNKEQLEAIKERVASMKQQARTDVTADISAIEIAFQDVPALIAEVERLQRFEQKAIYVIEENKRLQKERTALEFHLKVSSKALESEGEKADTFQRALEKIYDELGDMYEKNQALTRHRVLEIVCDIESALDGEPSLRDDDDE